MSCRRLTKPKLLTCWPEQKGLTKGELIILTRRKSRKKVAKPKKAQTEEPEEQPEEEQPQPSKPTTKSHSDRRSRLGSSDFPEKGELVVGTCTKITPHGAYFKIENYESLGDSAGFVHISELSRTWVRNIRKHIREGQRTVCRVMRANVSRQEVDLSIRRVSDSQRRETLQIHKQEQRSRGMLRAIGERLGLTPEQVEEDLVRNLEANYDLIYPILERARDEGSQVLIDIGISEELAEEITAVASRELERASVSLSGKITVSTFDPRGINLIRDAFTGAMKETLDAKAISCEVHVVSAPDYRVQIEASDWKVAEKCWKTFQDTFEGVFNEGTNAVLTLEFERE